jgi:hypothetical protein
LETPAVWKKSKAKKDNSKKQPQNAHNGDKKSTLNAVCALVKAKTR